MIWFLLIAYLFACSAIGFFKATLLALLSLVVIGLYNITQRL